MKTLTHLLIDRGDIPKSGPCWVRYAPGRIYATYHPDAPAGVSLCGVCNRLVLRALGRWWETLSF